VAVLGLDLHIQMMFHHVVALGLDCLIRMMMLFVVVCNSRVAPIKVYVCNSYSWYVFPYTTQEYAYYYFLIIYAYYNKQVGKYFDVNFDFCRFTFLKKSQGRCAERKKRVRIPNI
jgi:hypothetical protein